MKRRGDVSLLEIKWEPPDSSEGPGIGPYEAEVLNTGLHTHGSGGSFREFDFVFLICS